MNRAERRKAQAQAKSAATVAASSSLDVQRQLQQAFLLHQQQRFQEAELAYRQVLAINPRHVDALHLFGVMLGQLGHIDAAESLILGALQEMPQFADAYLNLARIYHQHGKFAEGEALIRSGLQRSVTSAQMYYFLGLFLGLQRKDEEAIAALQKAISAAPEWLEPVMQLAMLLKQMQRYDDAIRVLLHALEGAPNDLALLHETAVLMDLCNRSSEALKLLIRAEPIAKSLPPSVEILTLLGTVNTKRGHYDTAIAYYRDAIKLRPEDAMLWSNLAEAHQGKQDITNVEECYREALALNPSLWQLYLNIGSFYKSIGALDTACEVFERGLQLNPHSVGMLTQLAATYIDKALYDDAYEVLKRAQALNMHDINVHVALGYIENVRGNSAQAREHFLQVISSEEATSHVFSNYLFAMHYDHGVSPHDIYVQSKAWAQKYTDHLARRPHANRPDPLRKLRIGYVSADLCGHPVAKYIEPVLKMHNKEHFEVYCYANQTRNDEVTARLRSYADQWRPVYGLCDEVVADIIQSDAIDILIDLSGHTAGNRLTMFGLKPAPIQASWIGYFATTGMQAMDYFISDRFLLPPEDEALFVERPLRLPHSAAVYLVPSESVEVSALPFDANGHITFGCFNALSKLSDECLRVWAQLLLQLPDSKLMLKNRSFGDSAICERYRNMLGMFGIDASRIIFSGFSPMREYLEYYNQIDIALDPFPYNGGTTTLDALWMGVPIVAVKGKQLVSHIGESLLHAVSLSELVAENTDDYVRKALMLAQDKAKLRAIRSTLRGVLEATPNTNAALFTKEYESALRNAWGEWCQAHQK